MLVTGVPFITYTNFVLQPTTFGRFLRSSNRSLSLYPVQNFLRFLEVLYKRHSPQVHDFVHIPHVGRPVSQIFCLIVHNYPSIQKPGMYVCIYPTTLSRSVYNLYVLSVWRWKLATICILLFSLSSKFKKINLNVVILKGAPQQIM